jgi:hypothetical protein
MSKYRTDEETFASLKAKMKASDAEEYENFKHIKIEAGFDDRVFAVYQLQETKKETDPPTPKILSIIRVTSFETDLRSGASVRLYDETSGIEMVVGYVPKKLFSYPIYISLPVNMLMRVGTQMQSGGVRQTFTFAMLFKCKDKAERYTPENFYVETPANLKKLFPIITNAPFKF